MAEKTRVTQEQTNNWTLQHSGIALRYIHAPLATEVTELSNEFSETSTPEPTDTASAFAAEASGKDNFVWL